MYRGNFRKFPQRWIFSTHNAFVYGYSAFNSLALILSAPVDLSERRDTNSLYTVCCLISGIENDVSSLSLTKCLSCVCCCCRVSWLSLVY